MSYVCVTIHVSCIAFRRYWVQTSIGGVDYSFAVAFFYPGCSLDNGHRTSSADKIELDSYVYLAFKIGVDTILLSIV